MSSYFSTFYYSDFYITSTHTHSFVQSYTTQRWAFIQHPMKQLIVFSHPFVMTSSELCGNRDPLMTKTVNHLSRFAQAQNSRRENKQPKRDGTKPGLASRWQRDGRAPTQRIELRDIEMAGGFWTHTHHCVGQHDVQTLDSPEDLYVHSVTHTSLRRNAWKVWWGLRSGGVNESGEGEEGPGERSGEETRGPCLYDHKWREQTPAVTCLCQPYSQLVCRGACVCMSLCDPCLATTGFNYAANFDPL